MKSLRSSGISTSFLTSMKSAIDPLKRLSSVRTLMTLAPPETYCAAKDLGSAIAARSPLLGEARLISAMTEVPDLPIAAAASLTFGACESCSANFPAGIRRLATSCFTPSIMDSSTVLIKTDRPPRFERSRSWLLDPLY